MKNITSAKTVLSLAALGLTCLSFNSAAMDKSIENALIDVCEAAQSKSLIKYKRTTKSYRLRDTLIARKVMCNGDNIITFAEKSGSYKIADRLRSSLTNVNIIDLANNSTFERGIE
jgi:hypothetical protein